MRIDGQTQARKRDHGRGQPIVRGRGTLLEGRALEVVAQFPLNAARWLIRAAAQLLVGGEAVGRNVKRAPPSMWGPVDQAGLVERRWRDDLLAAPQESPTE